MRREQKLINAHDFDKAFDDNHTDIVSYLDLSSCRRIHRPVTLSINEPVSADTTHTYPNDCLK